MAGRLALYLFALGIGGRRVAALLTQTVPGLTPGKVRQPADDAGTLTPAGIFRRAELKFLGFHFGRETQGQRVGKSRCTAETSP